MSSIVTDDDLVKEFIVESREHLATIEGDLLAIEDRGANIDETLVNKVFRAAHSIKGGAGFFELRTIQELAHKTENVLDMVRSREMIPSPEVINILLQSFDRLRELVNNHVDSNQSDISELVVSLTGLISSFLPQQEKPLLQQTVEIPAAEGTALIEANQFDLSQAAKRGEYVYLLDIDLIHDVQRHGKTPWGVMKDLMALGSVLECRINIAAVGTLDEEPKDMLPMEVLYATIMDPSLVGGACDTLSPDRILLIQDPSPPKVVPSKQESANIPAGIAPPKAKATIRSSTPNAATAPAPVVDETLRVNVHLLETLMNLAGELVLGRNQLQDAIYRGDTRILHACGQRISLVTSELQETIMQTRMQPIGAILGKFQRVVRDLARERGKEIRLDITGRDVEMDKAIVEGLADPLTHMVRNSVDHGIEDCETRISQGKPSEGMIAIRAYHAAGQVVIEISDDGKGLDPAGIASAALAKGRISEEQAMTMSDREKMALIFLPGLSTAEKVTNVSGRGVGMDVVKTNLDRLGGKVAIESEIGKGTTFRITLPLTLAIIPSLLVSVGKERFAIPQINVNELLRIPSAQVKKRIELVGNKQVLRLRDKLIPVVHLADALGMEGTFTDPVTGKTQPDQRRHAVDRRSLRSKPFPMEEALPSSSIQPSSSHERSANDRRYHAGSDLNIAVLSTGSHDYGLIVDDLHDTMEIVVRPLGLHLKACREYAGTTILGDGQVAVILDAAGLAAKAQLSSVDKTARAGEIARQEAAKRLADRVQLILFHNAPTESCAIPLDRISRLERISIEQVEMLGQTRSMQYRGRQLPLLMLKDVAHVGDIADDAELVVFVIESGGRETGLLGAMPVDITETIVDVDTSHRQKGIAGSCIMRNQTTLLVDINDLTGNFAGSVESSDKHISHESTGGAGDVTILLAEDSDFFRGQMRKLLEESGYTVLAAADGQAAWELLEQHMREVKLVVTDIEMPRMTGLDLTRRIRSEPSVANLPIIAVTTLADEEDIARGKAAGVNHYQIKLDRGRLLECVRQTLAQSTILSQQ